MLGLVRQHRLSVFCGRQCGLHFVITTLATAETRMTLIKLGKLDCTPEQAQGLSRLIFCETWVLGCLVKPEFRWRCPFSLRLLDVVVLLVFSHKVSLYNGCFFVLKFDLFCSVVFFVFVPWVCLCVCLCVHCRGQSNGSGPICLALLTHMLP